MMLLLLLQAAAAQAPDIELNVHARAKSVEVRQRGETSLTVRAEPEGARQVQAQVRPANKGATKLRNVEVNVHAEASIADPATISAEAETAPPQ